MGLYLLKERTSDQIKIEIAPGIRTLKMESFFKMERNRELVLITRQIRGIEIAPLLFR